MSKSDPIRLGDTPLPDQSHIGVMITPEPDIKKWVLWKRVSLAVGYCLFVWGMIIYGVFQLFG